MRTLQSRFTLGLSLLAVVWVLGSFVGIAQSGNNRPRMSLPQTQIATGKSTVTGKVIYKDNGQPLKGTRLRIFTSNDAGLVTFTNNHGEFRVEGLAAGKYYVALEGPGIAMQSGFGMRLPMPMTAIPRREDFEEIIPKHDAQFTVDGTGAVEVEIKVARGGSISGKVLKPNGAPVVGASVSFLTSEGVGTLYTARFSAQTDKDGAYKAEHLPEGNYLVAAAIQDSRTNLDIRARIRGEGQVVTYHPAAISIDQAQAVRVDPGRASGGVNITLVARNSYGVAGTVLRERDGTPVVGATVLLRNKEMESLGALVPGAGQRTTHTDSEGRWSFGNVMDGAYDVIALAPNERLNRTSAGPPDREEIFRESRQRFLISQQAINVAGADVTGLMMNISGPGSIVGRVETDSGDPLPANLVLFFELVSKASRPGLPLPVRVKPDGTFTFGNVQGGDFYVGIAFAPDSKFYVKSIDANGMDPQRNPLHVSEGADAGPVRVVISQGVGSMAGRVVQANGGLPTADTVVLLAPVESGRQRFRTSFISSRTNPDGSFNVSGPPGEYFVFARRRDELPPIVSEEFVRRASAKAVRITLVAGEERRVELRPE